jgi:hypothetical protein
MAQAPFSNFSAGLPMMWRVLNISHPRAGRTGFDARLATITDYRAETLQTFMKGNIAPGSIAKTDRLTSYLGAPDVTHEPHTVGPMAAHISLPAIHRVFSNLKTWALGVYQGVRRQHLDACLDEFTFRFNRRKSRHAAFATLLRIATAIKPVTHKMLIAQTIG